MFNANKEGVLFVNGKRYRPRVFRVGPRDVELYPVEVLARSLGKSSQTIRLWERLGWFPKPLYKMKGMVLGTAQQRWYSREQIINLHQAKNRFPFSAGRKQLRDQFFALVNQVFDEENVLDVERITVRVGTTATARTAAAGGSVSRSHPPRGARTLQQAPSAQKPQPVATGGRTVPRVGRVDQPDVRTTAPRPSGPRQPGVRGHDAQHPASAPASAPQQGGDYRRRPSGGVPATLPRTRI